MYGALLDRVQRRRQTVLAEITVATQAIARGYARDGGLHMPKQLPRITVEELRRWKHHTFVLLCEEIMATFVGEEIPRADLHQMMVCCFSGFPMTRWSRSRTSALLATYSWPSCATGHRSPLRISGSKSSARASTTSRDGATPWSRCLCRRRATLAQRQSPLRAGCARCSWLSYTPLDRSPR